MASGAKNGLSCSVQFQTLTTPRRMVLTPSPPVISREKLRVSFCRGM